jgi:hypothetical protein
LATVGVCHARRGGGGGGAASPGRARCARRARGRPRGGGGSAGGLDEQGAGPGGCRPGDTPAVLLIAAGVFAWTDPQPSSELAWMADTSDRRSRRSAPTRSASRSSKPDQDLHLTGPPMAAGDLSQSCTKRGETRPGSCRAPAAPAVRRSAVRGEPRVHQQRLLRLHEDTGVHGCDAAHLAWGYQRGRPSSTTGLTTAYSSPGARPQDVRGPDSRSNRRSGGHDPPSRTRRCIQPSRVPCSNRAPNLAAPERWVT